MRRAFSAHFAHFNDISKEATAVRPDEPAKARALRLALKNIRTASERTRKELKEDSLRRGKAIDGIHAVLEYALVPIEQAMDAIEKAEREKREAAEKELSRIAKEQADQIAAEVAAAKKNAAAPDREKLLATAAVIRSTAVPALASAGGMALTLRIREQLEKFAAWIESEAAKV